jgi:phage terminase small subunit
MVARAPELHHLGLLTVIGVMPLAVYCALYSRWREAEMALARMAG